MKVTPLDIRRKEFRRSVRGYLDEDVDGFLDAVADEVERVGKVNTELQDKVRSLEEQVSGHAHIREALEKTLVAAQLQSEEIRTTAQRESQSMLREAEAKAKAEADAAAKAAAAAKAKADAEAAVKAEAEAKAKAEADAVAAARQAREAEEKALQEKRAQERKSAATHVAVSGPVAMTAAALQLTEQEKILAMLNRFHKRAQ